MSLCGAFVTLALNATLLGTQSLKVEARHDVSSTECTTQNESTNPNAVLSLKDRSGAVVFSQKIRIADFDFYANGETRGGLPSKDAIVLINYPSTKVTDKASSVELKMIEFPYSQSARLPASISPAPAPTTHELSLK
jgi:hypothetical protein